MTLAKGAKLAKVGMDLFDPGSRIGPCAGGEGVKKYSRGDAATRS
jgi:hypothetical protein